MCLSVKNWLACQDLVCLSRPDLPVKTWSPCQDLVCLSRTGLLVKNGSACQELVCLSRPGLIVKNGSACQELVLSGLVPLPLDSNGCASFATSLQWLWFYHTIATAVALAHPSNGIALPHHICNVAR